MRSKRDELRGVLREHKADLRQRVSGPAEPPAGRRRDALHLAAQLVPRADSWMSMVSGQGVEGMDKRRASSVQWRGLLFTEHRAETLVAGNNLARRIVELLPYEATRRWIKTLNLGDADRDVRDDMDRLNARECFNTGWAWGRQFGGAAVLMVTDEPDEDLAKPLDLKKVKRLENLVVLNRWELDAWNSEIEVNLRDPNFRHPRYYRLSVTSGGIRIPVNVKIHHSRLIRFHGQPLTPLLFIRNKYWGDSVFSGLMDPLANWDRSMDGVAAVLEEFRFIVHKMEDIADQIAAGNHDKVLNRVRAAAAGRSLFGTMVADKSEDIVSQSESFAGVTDVLDRLADNLASHTDYPKIVLFNSSPDGGGLDGKGNSELQGWYSTVGARQTTYLAPKLDVFLKVLLAAKEGPVRGNPPKDWDYEFEPLFNESAGEKALREKTEAESDGERLAQGVQDEIDIMERRFPDKLKGKDTEQMRKAIQLEKQRQMELDLKRLEGGAGPGDPTGGKAAGAA
jgi:phage-related protein (TIGR01555 family)